MSKGSFAGRWSRLKREAEAPAPETEPRIEPEAEAEPEIEPEISAEEIAALPPVETLEPGADLGPFLRRGVPRALRQAALRRMWTINPAIRDYVDPAREYALDWNAPGGVPGGGAVSPSEVAAMLGRLFRPPASAEPAAAPPSMPAETLTETPAETPAAPPDAPAAPVVAAPAAPADPSPAAPRPRHGSATPV